MFVVSIKTGKRKMVAVLAVALVVITAVSVFARMRAAAPTAVCEEKKYSLTAATNEERVSFFRQFGWTVDAEPLNVADVSIPTDFDDVYVSYNNIQKEQGLDLTAVAGKTCKQYVYKITNYPQQESMKGTLLIYNGAVVGGDLSTPELDGFMTGFNGEIESEDYSVNQPTLARGTDNTLTMASSEPVSSAAEEAKKSSSSEIPANAWPTD